MWERKQKNLYEYLSEVKDFRRWQWKRHDIWVLLLIVVMAIMSGYNGIRATWDFIEKHKEELSKIFWTKHNRLPTFQTIGRVLQYIEYEEFEKKFSEWMKVTLWSTKTEWIALDGKVIWWTVTNAQNSLQRYTNLVSAYSINRKQVLKTGEVWWNKKSEIPVVQRLIEELWLHWVVFTMDALHCQTETLKTIVKTKNDYVVWVKWNQKNLHNTVKKNKRM